MASPFTKEIDLHYASTPNGWKVEILLEELAIPYKIHNIDITKGDQFTPEFVKVNPNSKIPAIVDHNQLDHQGQPFAVFESGAILIYIAQKAGKLLPDAKTDPVGNAEVIEWVMWQMAGLGPMFGQFNHFTKYAPEKIQYGIDRYGNESRRLLKVLDAQLASQPYVAKVGYSIADIAIFGWVFSFNFNKILEIPPNVTRWLNDLTERPVIQKLTKVYTERILARANQTLTEEQRKILFGQK